MVKRMQYDRWLLLITAALVGIGALMVYSSTSVVTVAFAKKSIGQFHYFKKHFVTMLIAVVFMFIAYKTSIKTLKKIAIPLLVFSFILLVLVFVPGLGVTAGGAKRWLRLWPSTFQPSELLKLSMIIFLARYMAMPSYRLDSKLSFLIPIGIMGLFQLIFLKQPDFGAAMSLGLLTFFMLILSGARLRYIMSLTVLLIPVIVKLVMEPYRLKRVLTFLDPWKDSQGGGFQLVQSVIALGSGGLSGIGLGKSKQKLSFLPESHTDFIFSLVGEELGFIGAFIIVGLFLALFFRGILIASRADASGDRFVYYLASGLSMMIALQALINFFVVTGLAPTKGLPLPFISYGGSSLLVNMVAVGILLNLSKAVGSKVAGPNGVGGMREEDRIESNRAQRLLERKKAVVAVYGRGQHLRDNR